jgi:hypothetical protein
MFKLFLKSQEVQFNWIRNHPVQYVALNAALLVAGYVYVEYKDRKEMRKLENETTDQTN